MRSLIGSIVDKSPVPYVSTRSGGVGLTATFGVDTSRTAQLATLKGNGTLFGVVTHLSTSTAAVKWRLYKTAKSGKDEDRTEITKHPALTVWNKPNTFMRRRFFVEATDQHGELTGEAWWVVYRVAGVPIELWPVRPDRMKPVVDPNAFCLGYTYTAPDGERVPLGLDEVIRPIHMPDPEDIYRGLGPVQALMRTLDSARFSEEWNRAFFVNGAEPGAIIEAVERLSDDEWGDFRKRWAESHQGVSNAHRVAILENGMKYVPVKFTMRDMQFRELAELGDDKILKAFGVSKFAIGVVDDVNRATAEAALALDSQTAIVPRLDRLKDALNGDLLPMFGSTTVGLEFDYDNPVEPSQETENATLAAKASAAQQLIGANFTGDSVVIALGLPESLVWEKPEPPAPPTPPGDGEPVQDSWHGRFPWLRNEYTPPDLSDVQSEWTAELDALMADWQQVHAEQLDEIERQVREAVANRDPIALVALGVSASAATTLLAGAMTALATVAAATVVREAALQGVVITAGVADAGELTTVATVNATLLGNALATAAGREALRRYTTLSDPAELAGAVRAFVAEVPASTRATLGAALTRAQNAGRGATFALAPAARYYATEVLDKNTCGPCRRIDGQELPTLDAATLAYGGGPYLFCEGTVRCRGTYIAVWDITTLPGKVEGHWSGAGWLAGAGPFGWDSTQHLRDPVTGEFVEMPGSAREFMRSLDGVADVAETALAADLLPDDAPEWHRLTSGSSGSVVRLATLGDGRKIVHKEMRDLGDPGFARVQADAEHLGSLTGRALGVPVARVYRDSGESPWIEHIPGNPINLAAELAGRDAATGEAFLGSYSRFRFGNESARMGLLDAVTGNRDRHDGNIILTPDDRFVGIDAAYGFQPLGYYGEGVTPDDLGNTEDKPVARFIETFEGDLGRQNRFINNPMTPADVEETRRRLESLREDFDKLGRGEWLDNGLAMLDLLGEYAAGTDSIYGED